jgi:threonine dehydrogenase-like Zn-dependent dehydrogenase
MSTYNRVGALDDRHTVLIQGAGPLGLFATAVAATRGVKKVIIVGAPDARLELARELGADAAISIEHTPDPADRLAQVRDLTEGRGADVVLEFAGTAAVFGEGVAMAAPKARYVMAGAVGAVEPRPFSSATIIHKNLTIVGSLGSTIGAYAQALAFIERNASRFPWDKLVGPGRYPLESSTVALERTRDLKETKAVILTQD